MLAAVQYSAAEIAFGVLAWFLAAAFFWSWCEGILYDRREYRDWKRDRDRD